MVTAQIKRSETQYRAIPVDSSSTIKQYLIDPKAYFEEFVLGLPKVVSDNRSALIGSLVHCLLLEPDNFDDKYHASSCSEKPTEKMLEFTNALYDFTMETTDESGVNTEEFSETLLKAYNKVGFSWKIDTVIKKWSEGTGEAYYRELLQTKPRGLSVVTEFDMKIAEDIVNTIKSDEFVHSIVNQDDTEDIEVYNELQLEGEPYNIYGLPMKGMVDKLILDHTNKKISPYDLKVVWEVSNFYEGYYLYRRSYIQAFIYWKLLEIWSELMGYEDYDLEYPRFIVVDSGNFYRPLIYKLSSDDMVGANSGFIHRGRYYKGVQEIITDLRWARDKNEWKIGREQYINFGVVNLKS